ncbi:MAG: TetR/AcrR family transcriptional regulator [Candidatus Adiutrix sp.]
MSTEPKERALEILQLATRLFAKHGYEGVSVRDICSALDLNCSTISYYFGGKKGLYLEVLKSQFESYESCLNTIISQNTNPKEELEALCSQSSHIHALSPHLSMISARESCNPSPEYMEALHAHEAKYNGGHLAALIRTGQQQGFFNPRLNPIYLARIVSMVLNSYIIAKSTFSFLHPEMRFSDKEYFETAKAFLFDGLLAPKENLSADDKDARPRRITKGLW